MLICLFSCMHVHMHTCTGATQCAFYPAIYQHLSTCLTFLTFILLLLQLLDTKAVGVRREKMYKLDDHLACAVAGITGAPWCQRAATCWHWQQQQQQCMLRAVFPYTVGKR
jgi:hypothetical protein